MSNLGATGDYPEGKLGPNDEGALQFAITHYQGKVVVNFNTPVSWFGMAPADARHLAELLNQHADDAEAQS